MPATYISAKADTVDKDHHEGPVRDRILHAALHLMGSGEGGAVSQAKVAAAAGVRQSHLTYYFPKRGDLLAALLEGHIHHAHTELRAIEAGEAPDDMSTALDTLMTDKVRIRFFLRLILEADQDPRLRPMVEAHMAHFQSLVCAYFGRPDNDDDVELFLNTLRGAGLRAMVSGQAPAVAVMKVARLFGLQPANT